MKLFYRCIDHCEETYYAFETGLVSEGVNETDDFDLVAEEAAEDYYYSNHDGFKSAWPLTFSIHETSGGPELDRYIVSIETRPTFNAAQVE
jgi:hypothetical protein